MAFGGSVRIEGEVLDNAVALGGTVEVEEGGTSVATSSRSATT